MLFTINETGEQKVLECHSIYADGTYDCAPDIIRDCGALGKQIQFNSEDKTYHIAQSDFDWWKEFIYNCEYDERDLDMLRHLYGYAEVNAVVDMVSKGKWKVTESHEAYQFAFDYIYDALEPIPGAFDLEEYEIIS